MTHAKPDLSDSLEGRFALALHQLLVLPAFAVLERAGPDELESGLVRTFEDGLPMATQDSSVGFPGGILEPQVPHGSRNCDGRFRLCCRHTSGIYKEVPESPEGCGARRKHRKVVDEQRVVLINGEQVWLPGIGGTEHLGPGDEAQLADDIFREPGRIRITAGTDDVQLAECRRVKRASHRVEVLGIG